MEGRNSMYNLLMGRTPVNTFSNSYNALGRTFGLSPVGMSSGNSTNSSSDDNFFLKRAKSLENALGTTGAVIAGGIDVGREDRAIEERGKRFDESMKDIYKNAGYDNVDDYNDAKDAAQREAFGKIGFDIDDLDARKSDAWLAQDWDTFNNLENEYRAAKDRLSEEDRAKINSFDEIQNKLKNQSTMNVNEQREAQKNWEDYRKNSYIGQKTNQDRGKFLGSAINTLSTAFDVMAPGAGVLANSVQGGIEGVADELEQNGLENFDLQRAGQNALIGATTGAVTGGLNKGVNNMLAKNGGNLFKGGNAITRTMNNLGSNTAAGRIGSTLATGAARGALSGAVGGATGAGLSAAMNGQDVLGSAIQGAQQGFGQGALAGGVMAGANMAANATPGVGDAMRKFNEAGENFNNSGDSFAERVKNTWNSGDSPVANRITEDVNAIKRGFGNVAERLGTLSEMDKTGLLKSVRNVGLGIENVANKERIPQNIQVDQTEQYRTIPQEEVTMQAPNSKDLAKEAKQRLKDVKADALRTRAAEDLLNQAGTAKSRAAQADNMVENVKSFMDAGLTKPEEWQLAADMVTGSNGVLSKMHRNLVDQAGQVDTFSGVGGKYGSGIEDTINYYIKKSGMTDSHGKAMYNEIMGVIDSLPSRLDGSLGMSDNASDVMKVVRELESHRRNYLGEDSGNYATSDPFKRQKAKVINDVTSLLEGRVYDNIPDATKVITPEAVQELKNAFPGNGKWAREVDATFDNIKTGKDLRAAQKMFVQTSDYLKNIKDNYGTYGQKVGDAYGNALSQGLKKVPIIGGFASEIANSPAANRVFANINSARADRLEGNPVDFISRKTINDNTAGNGGGDNRNTVIPTNNSGQAMPNNVVETAYNPATRVYEAIGRTEGLTNAEQARTADYLAQASQGVNSAQSGNTLESIMAPGANNGSTSVYNSVYGGGNQNTATIGSNQGAVATSANSYYPSTGDYWTDVIGIAMTNAINDEDYKTFGALYEMYQNQVANLQKSSNKDYSNPINWSASDRGDLLSAQDGMGMIDSLEQSYLEAVGEGGGNVLQGTLRGIANNISGGNLDRSASNYEKQAASIGAGIIKNLINLGSTEYDAARYVDYLPKITDTKEQAAQKLQVLRDAYQRKINNLYSVYGV